MGIFSVIQMIARCLVNKQRWAFVALILVTMAFSQAYADTTANSAAACFKRADRYEKEANKYANDVRDPRKWFDLAMKNYLCAAQAGNALAMLRVVNLSGSGQVEALPKEMEDKYLLQAAEAGLAEAQVGLGVSYCDNIGSTSPCKNPVEAEIWFLRAARAGDANGAFELGILYERGTGGSNTVKTERALACYQLASKRIRAAIRAAINAKDAKDAKEENIFQLKSLLERPVWGIERTTKILGVHEISVTCY